RDPMYKQYEPPRTAVAEADSYSTGCTSRLRLEAPAHAEDEAAFILLLERRLIFPLQVVVLVLVREIEALQVHGQIRRDVVAHRGVDVVGRRLIERQAFRAPHLIERDRTLAAMIVRNARLEALALVPYRKVRLLLRVVQERHDVAVEILVARIARRIGVVRIDTEVAPEARQVRERMLDRELAAFERPALALHVRADVDFAAYHTVMVGQRHPQRTALDEALHTDVEDRDRDHRVLPLIPLERRVVVRRAPRVERRIAVGVRADH